MSRIVMPDGTPADMTAPAVEFSVLSSDNPWRFDDNESSKDKKFHGTTGDHYPTMSLTELCLLQLPPMTYNAHLFLWRVGSMVEEAYKVVRAWGFTPKAELVWWKQTATGKRWFGMGRQVRNEHEIAIIATRGKGARSDNKSTRSGFGTVEACNIDEDGNGSFEARVPGGRHSAKPDEFYAIVESLTVGHRCELFARRHRPGWTCYGNQLGPLPEESAT